MNQTKFICIACSLIVSSFLSSCKKDDKKDNTPVISSQGVYVVNEGAFGGSNGSISYLDLQTNIMYNNIFQTINGFPLGDVAQSMMVHQSKAYLVVNVSQKVEVVDANTFNSQATITGFSGPRYMVARGNKGYVSDWFDDNVKIIDLNSHSIVNSIATGVGPEQILIDGNKLFVTNVGGWGRDSTVTIINLDNESVITTLQVGVNPNSLCRDANGKIWILCGGSTGDDFIGGTADDIAGSVWRIDPGSLTIEWSHTMNASDHPSKMQANQSATLLYYLNGIDGYNGKVHTISIASPSVSATPSIGKDFYGLGIDPNSGTIYGGLAPNFTQNGYVFRYKSDFTLLDSIEAGIAPNYFSFR